MASSCSESCSPLSERDPCTSKEEFHFLYAPSVAAEVEVEENEKSEKGRKRKRNPDNWKKKHVKRHGLRKNSPSEMITNHMECCQKKCIQIFSVPHLQRMRKHFESMMYDEQNIYLNGLLHRRETKKASGHPRKANPAISVNGKRVGRPPAESSMFSFQYSLRNEKGIDIRVCQKAFCKVHGFGPKRIRILRHKVQSGLDLEPDKRGKHTSHRSVSEELKQLVRDHIETYPTRHSHYSRKNNQERVYLPSDMSIARLHREFLQKYDPEFIKLEETNRKRILAHEAIEKLRKPLITEHMYHDIFVTEYNIYFGYPRSDSCSTCDSLTIQIESASESEKPKLQESLQAHQQLAEEGYHAFRYDRDLSYKSWGEQAAS